MRQTLTQRLIKLSLRLRGPSLLSDEAESLVEKSLAEAIQPSRETELNEIGLVAVWSIGIVLEALIAIPIAAMKGLPHRIGAAWFLFVAACSLVGVWLHIVRFIRTHFLYIRESREFDQGRRDFSDRKGERRLSSDRDLVFQAMVGVVAVLIWSPLHV